MSIFEVRRYKGYRLYRVGISWCVFDGPSTFHPRVASLEAAKAWINSQPGVRACVHGVCRRFRQIEYATGQEADRMWCAEIPEVE